MDSKEPSQPLIQLELQRLIIQKKQNGATNILVPRTFNLKSVRFLGSGDPSPFDQVIVRSIQVLVKLNDEGFEKRTEKS